MTATSRAMQFLSLAALLLSPSAAQTFTSCNPLVRTDCPPDPALSKSIAVDFAGGANDGFVPQGNPTYGPDGVSFTVAKSGDSPQLTSKWYIMFGKVEVTLKAAPGAGIVSSVVLQSDDLDEIDWEWLGADGGQVQSNYFGKGQTITYDRGATHANPGNQASFKTYSIEWTPEQIVWQIDGVTVRALLPANSNNQYPQTPMQLKFGSWSGGDPANAKGTIEWAKGPTDYSKGPFTMLVKSIRATDYSTGKEYRYGDQSGTWQSIIAVDGKVNAGGSTVIETAAPGVTASPSGQQPIPFQSTTYTKPSVYPWVPDQTTLATATVPYTTLPGLPSGWTVSNSGKVVPNSSATPTEGADSSSPSSPSGLGGGSEVETSLAQKATPSPSGKSDSNGSGQLVPPAAWCIASVFASFGFLLVL